ncbi:MAG: LptF/LptG family permease, partial [Gammaproteobacteria bacterium]|nr:LptF/LptG family permease [Gammaproteobacteria bacterium]
MIIHRAFIREVLQTAGAVIVIILSIFLATRAVYFLRQAAEGDIPIGGVTLLVLLKTITYLDIMVPLVVYIAMLMVLGRWVRDNELTVISACGISMGRFIRPTFMLFLGVGSVVALLSLY